MNDNEHLLEWLRKLRQTDAPIVVEGPKDERALVALGAKRIVRLSRKPLFAIAEEVANEYDNVILLTDFDKKGKELYGRLSKLFNRLGVKVDSYFRETLQKHARISHIEGLYTALKTKEMV